MEPRKENDSRLKLNTCNEKFSQQSEILKKSRMLKHLDEGDINQGSRFNNNIDESIFDHEKQMEQFANKKTNDTEYQDSQSNYVHNDIPFAPQNRPKFKSINSSKQKGLQAYNKSRVEAMTPNPIPFNLNSSNSDNDSDQNFQMENQSFKVIKMKNLNFGSNRGRKHLTQALSCNPNTGLKTPEIGRIKQKGSIFNLQKIQEQIFKNAEQDISSNGTYDENGNMLKQERYEPNFQLTEDNQSIMFHMLLQSSNEDHSNSNCSSNHSINLDYKNYNLQ